VEKIHQKIVICTVKCICNAEALLSRELGMKINVKLSSIKRKFFNVKTEKENKNTTKDDDSSVGTALGYGLNDRGSMVRFPAGAENLSLHHRVQNGSGAHSASTILFLEFI
jgi:hypothetical protein